MSNLETDNPSGPDPATDGSSDTTSRRKFVRGAGLASGGAAMAAFIAACGGSSKTASTAATATTATTSQSTTSSASSAGMTQDLAILNYALTLEYLEATFYDRVIASKLLTSSEQDLAKNFGAAEHSHVEALTATIKKLGGTPVKSPKFKFPITARDEVLKLAATVENVGASAYLGQAPRISNKEVLAAALSIHSVEARHAAALNDLLKMSPTPNGAFAVPRTMTTVLGIVKPFIV